MMRRDTARRKKMSKTHYRKVFKSDHLGVADLEDMIESNTPLIFTVDHVNQEFGVMVAGRKGNHNIAYFKEKIKPLVLNATNSKVMKGFANGSAFVEDWNNIPVKLYIENNIRFGSSVVDGVRISPTAPRMAPPELTPNNKKQWANALVAVREGRINDVKKRMTVSPENEKALIKEAGNVA
jgi:hypothetical protein